MTTPAAQPLDALQCPLSGVNLIEASAGTGKTWTIAALYLRLLLEAASGEPPTVDQILVVTYTKAATAELRDRLRQRLAEFARVLDGELAGDAFLQALAQRFPAGQPRELARQRLTAAITGFDAAAIYTIHGFCQRVLTDAAFESGQTFAAELVTDDERRLSEAVDDFWRRRVVTDPLLARVLAESGDTPDGWLADIRPHLAKSYLRFSSPAPGALQQAQAQVTAAWQRLAENPAQLTTAAELLLTTQGFKANIYSPSTLARLIDSLQTLLAAPDTVPVLSSHERKLLDKWRPGTLARGMKKGATAPEHPLFELVEQWLTAWDAYLSAVAHAVARLKLELIDWVNAELARRRVSERTRSFDDLLTDLAAALEHPDTGQLLVNHVARTFRVALIDEFQDTDPTQYGIFRRCFIQRPAVEAIPVFLVGDPKQAIYSFRGADIFAYLQARDDARHHYTLDTNRRSDAPLVASVNALFARPLPFVLKDIDYQPVQASPSSGAQLEIDDDVAPFSFQTLTFDSDKPASKQLAGDLAAESTANEIARLLQLAQQQRAAIVQHGQRRALNGGDIAVLVSTHRQGDRIRQALAARAVPSVALTQESVFASREAGELLAVLRAWAEPTSDGRLRRALVTELMGLNAAELCAQVEDESAWEHRLLTNAADHQRWLDHGFMAAWRHFFSRAQLAERLLPLPDGERRLTNLSHLAELIQQESEQRQGMAPLLSWLESKVARPPSGEDAVLRLESDAQLVKIVTLHTSKGLQYPVVFCPFLWDGALERRDTAFWRYHDEQDQSWLAPEVLADASVREQARTETLAEKLRLLYVALTRAQYRQYVAWGWVKDMQTAALSWLLHGEQASTLPQLEELELSAADIERGVQQFVHKQHGAAGLQAADASLNPLPASLAHTRTYAAQRFERPLYTPWRVSSFSALTSRLHGTAQAERPDHDRLGPEETAAMAEAGVPDRYAFPRGSRAGTCLHAMFERLDFAADEYTIAQVVSDMLARHGFAEHWLPAAVDLVTSTLHAELDAGVRLADVAAGKRLVELEFTLPVQRLELKALIAVLTDPAHGLAEPLRAAARQLDFASVQGYLKGFIDLVFEADGRLYLVDYKSNHLGSRPEDYHRAALDASMAKEHYYLQALIYCVALKRYFQARGVAFGQRFAGVRYLYLRGIGQGDHGIWAARPSDALLEALDRVFGS